MSGEIPAARASDCRTLDENLPSANDDDHSGGTDRQVSQHMQPSHRVSDSCAPVYSRQANHFIAFLPSASGGHAIAQI